jgi:hypothetical protein
MEKLNILPKFTVDMKIIEENKKVNPKKVFEQPAKSKPKKSKNNQEKSKKGLATS